MRYILDNTELPRPKSFKREFISISERYNSLSGKIGKDVRTTKEKYILTWEIVSSTELSNIMTIVNKNTSVNFQIAEEKLIISSTSVIVKISNIEYTIPGSSYYCSFALELEEVE